MPKSAQKSLNSLAVNWVPLSVIMLLGMPNWYIISDEFYHLSPCNGGDGLDFDHLWIYPMLQRCVWLHLCLFWMNLPDKAPMLKKAKWRVWSEVNEMTHASGEQKTGTLHNSGPKSRHQIRQWASRTHACMVCPQACGTYMTATDPHVNVLKNNASFIWHYTSH
jgi:hypothetical protein